MTETYQWNRAHRESEPSGHAMAAALEHSNTTGEIRRADDAARQYVVLCGTHVAHVRLKCGEGLRAAFEEIRDEVGYAILLDAILCYQGRSINLDLPPHLQAIPDDAALHVARATWCLSLSTSSAQHGSRLLRQPWP